VIGTEATGIDCLARWFVRLADSHSRELQDSSRSLAHEVGADLLTATVILASHAAGDQADLDDDRREVVTNIRAAPSFEARVARLRALRIQEAEIAARVGRRLQWQSDMSREVLRQYWNMSTGDGIPDSFTAWIGRLPDYAAE
jgi:hypothetical protein